MNALVIALLVSIYLILCLFALFVFRTAKLGSLRYPEIQWDSLFFILCPVIHISFIIALWVARVKEINKKYEADAEYLIDAKTPPDKNPMG